MDGARGGCELFEGREHEARGVDLAQLQRGSREGGYR
jgi:hypothetical protein